MTSPRDLSHDRRFSARAVAAYTAGPQPHAGLFRAAADGGVPDIMIYDVIGADMWGEGVTAAGVVSALAQAGGSPINVRINSPGGDAFEGVAIYNALLNYAGGVTVQVDGIAASAASIIAMAGKPLNMNAASMLMIHDARTIAYGTGADMAQTAAVLQKVDTLMAGVYAAKTGKAASTMSAMMDAETYMTADDAKSAGFCDAVLGADPAPAAKPAKAEAGTAIVAEAEPVIVAEADPFVVDAVIDPVIVDAVIADRITAETAEVARLAAEEQEILAAATFAEAASLARKRRLRLAEAESH